jgi:enamine deaminase RidA (YjgF/YER057c/UK114 family)
MSKIKKYRILFVSILLIPAFTDAQITLTGTPASIISNTAEIPAGYQYFFTSGFVAANLKPELDDSNYEKYGNTEAQAEDILKRIKTTLESNGYSLKDVFSMKVYVAPDTKSGQYDFAGWNNAYKRYFGTADNPNKPVRATIGIATLVNSNKFIEIEVIAAKKPD